MIQNKKRDKGRKKRLVRWNEDVIKQLRTRMATLKQKGSKKKNTYPSMD